MNGGKNGTPKARRKEEAGLFLEGSGSSRARKGKKITRLFGRLLPRPLSGEHCLGRKKTEEMVVGGGGMERSPP